MKISVLTVFPQLYEQFLKTSLVGRAQQSEVVSVDVVPFFAQVRPKERIDSPTFGPGSGMLIKPAVIEKSVEAQEAKHGAGFKIFFSPQGEKLTQHGLKALVKKIESYDHCILVASRYEGIDERVEAEYADALISIGDFVLMGGDLPAMMLIEGMLRLIPGVVGKGESVEHESFSGPFLDYPVYTEPLEWHGKQVPEIVRSGNHGAIETWRKDQAAQKTVKKHFSWLRSQHLSREDIIRVGRYVPHHYVVLMHSDVLVGPDRQKGVTSVTSIDIHDIARSSATYGIEQFFIVTPLQDQQKIVGTLLDFWQKGIGVEYNRSRHEAVDRVRIKSALSDVIDAITQKEGKAPVVIATSAGSHTDVSLISYAQQSLVWAHERPVLLLFGTGKGLDEALLKAVDYVLLPVHGLSAFNHLSVRSAVAIVLDRWLGINEKTV